MIDSTFTYNGCKTVLHMQNTWVKLDEPSMYRHGLGTLETERLNVSNIVDMINITTKKYTSVMIRVCHSRSRFLSCMYIHDKFMTESR